MICIRRPAFRRGVGQFVIPLTLVAGLLLFAGCKRAPEPGTVLDEAMTVGRTAESFPAADEDYFREMDGGIDLSPDEVKGRNMWLLWTGGNDRQWDELHRRSTGVLDFLKTLSSHPSLKDKFSRDNRWRYFGLVNEPCFVKPDGPRKDRYGLWLDVRSPDCPPDPFENEQKYPGVKTGARGVNVPVGSYYGYATGVVGMRLFPNPAFDAKAESEWDPERYYTDRSYYERKDLVLPYRVGVSCAFCHVGPNPLNPPPDPEHPEWKHLSSNVGAQYFWVDRIFAWEADYSAFPFQIFHTSRPGALDTSFVSVDNINNPRTMNAVYRLPARMALAKRWGREQLAGGELNNRQFNDFFPTGPLSEFFEPPNTVWTPRVLKDGSDSVGALGALNRVYLNIGLFSEEWFLHFTPLIGGTPNSPIEIAVAQKNSAYWQATEQQTPYMAAFFLKATAPHHLKDAPGGQAYLSRDANVLRRGKVVFAEYCARCHSSKIPANVPGVDGPNCVGAGYLKCWDDYWAHTKTDAFKAQMRKIVLADDFLEGNFLSTELRVPVTLLQVNACSTLATNAIKGDIWDNFSSDSYKQLPSVGKITIYHPVTGEPSEYQMPAGGRGYLRPASLISLWSTAPFLLNNSVGKFEWSPSVEARMRSFDDSIEKLLWPEKRRHDALLGDKVPGMIDRTTTQSYLRVPGGYLPEFLRPMLGTLQRYLPWLFGEGGIEIGPIPKGTPVGLISNIELVSESGSLAERIEHRKKLLALLIKVKKDLKALPENASDEEARAVLGNLVNPLLEVSKCPDLVVNRGHYFGTQFYKEEAPLSDSDKRALIEFLKTF